MKKKLDIFRKKWLQIADITKDILLDRYKKTCALTKVSFPNNTKYNLWCEKFSDATNLEEIFKHGTLSIGFIGLSEAFEVLSKERFYKSSSLYAYAKDFVKFMRDYTDSLRKIFHLNFSLLATAGESISGGFLQQDIKLFNPK